MTIFNHIKEIYQNQDINYFDNLSDEDKSTYYPYMINKIISMTFNFCQLANEVQVYLTQLKPREHYLFYSNIIPKGNYYSKYIKKSGKAKYSDEDIKLLSQYLQISTKETKYYLTIVSKPDELLLTVKTYYGKNKN